MAALEALAGFEASGGVLRKGLHEGGRGGRAGHVPIPLSALAIDLLSGWGALAGVAPWEAPPICPLPHAWIFPQVFLSQSCQDSVLRGQVASADSTEPLRLVLFHLV